LLRYWCIKTDSLDNEIEDNARLYFGNVALKRKSSKHGGCVMKKVLVLLQKVGSKKITPRGGMMIPQLI
jgi:hypothetical protein